MLRRCFPSRNVLTACLLISYFHGLPAEAFFHTGTPASPGISRLLDWRVDIPSRVVHEDSEEACVDLWMDQGASGEITRASGCCFSFLCGNWFFNSFQKITKRIDPRQWVQSRGLFEDFRQVHSYIYIRVWSGSGAWDLAESWFDEVVVEWSGLQHVRGVIMFL